MRCISSHELFETLLGAWGLLSFIQASLLSGFYVERKLLSTLGSTLKQPPVIADSMWFALCSETVTSNIL
jgi:hypothetical protein